MSTRPPLEQLRRISDPQAMLRRLRELLPDRDDQAALLWEGARAGVLSVATGSALILLERAEAPFDARDLLAALRSGPPQPRWTTPRWWAGYNLHEPFRAASGLVARLQDAGPLLDALDTLEGLLRCAAEVTLAAQGVIEAAELSEGARADFFAWSLHQHFPETIEDLGRAAWGARWPAIQVEVLPALAWVDPALEWRPVARPERFLGVIDQLSPQAAMALASRGYWDDLATPLALLEGRPDISPQALDAAAREWLDRMGATGASYGGYGALLLFLTLHRRGLLEPRHLPLLSLSMYSDADIPLLEEAIRALPLEERARRALQYDQVSWLYAAACPVEDVVLEAIETVRAKAKRERSPHLLQQIHYGFDGFGAVAAGPLRRALSDGRRAPLDDVLVERLGRLQDPEAAPVLREALARNATREAAARGLAALGEDLVMPLLEEDLFAPKKDLRLGAALALSLLPASPARAELAQRRLAKERATEVIDLLTPLTSRRGVR